MLASPMHGTMEVPLSGSHDYFQAFSGSTVPLPLPGANVLHMAFFTLVYCPYGCLESTCAISHGRPVESVCQKYFICFIFLFFSEIFSVG